MITDLGLREAIVRIEVHAQASRLYILRGSRGDAMAELDVIQQVAADIAEQLTDRWNLGLRAVASADPADDEHRAGEDKPNSAHNPDYRPKITDMATEHTFTKQEIHAARA